MNEAIIIAIALLACVGIYVAFSRRRLILASLFNGAGQGSSNRGANKVQALFFKTVFTLLGYVARRDGPVNRQEIRRTETFMEKMELAADQKREAIRLFKAGAAAEFNVADALDEFKSLARKSPNLTQILLVYLVNLARVDGLLVEEEVDAVRKVASGLGYSNITFAQLLKMMSSQDKFGESPRTGNRASGKSGHQDNSGQDQQQQYRGFENEQDKSNCAYDALGLTPKASDAEVKKAYRELANKFHPDKLISQDLPPFMVGALTERFKTIQAAYDCIKKERS